MKTPRGLIPSMKISQRDATGENRRAYCVGGMSSVRWIVEQLLGQVVQIVKI
jgi:hypothetical protein